jgi:acetyltransferase-like isoleucine patch superfamily enzyme
VKKNIKIITRKYEDRIKPVCRSLKNMSFYPKSILQFLHVNIFRKNTINNFRKGQFFFPTRYTVLNIHKPAHIYINGSMLYGYKRIKDSKLESRLAIEGNGSLIIENGHVSVFYGCDILVSNGANLTFKGSASLNQRVQIICMDSITIGKDVMIARDVVIRDNDGRHELLAESYKKTAPIIIGDRVWIGQGAIIMKGVTIGDGAIINAGAWVATNIKPNTIVM